jgi:hypothetical protein
MRYNYKNVQKKERFFSITSCMRICKAMSSSVVLCLETHVNMKSFCKGIFELLRRMAIRDGYIYIYMCIYICIDTHEYIHIYTYNS